MAQAIEILTGFVMAILLLTSAWAGAANITLMFVASVPLRAHARFLVMMVGCLLAARWLYHLSGGTL